MSWPRCPVANWANFGMLRKQVSLVANWASPWRARRRRSDQAGHADQLERQPPPLATRPRQDQDDQGGQHGADRGAAVEDAVGWTARLQRDEPADGADGAGPVESLARSQDHAAGHQ